VNFLELAQYLQHLLHYIESDALHHGKEVMTFSDEVGRAPLPASSFFGQAK
jgi:hypothetical protein